MSKPRVKLIVNPNADMGNAWRHASDLRHLADEHVDADWAGTVYPTQATELARKAAEDGYEYVIAVGGDGTAHEVINGLMLADVEKRPKFGIVPMGSGNDYAANLGLPKDPEKALLAILTGKSKMVDIALLEDEHGRKEYWNNTVNIGFGGSVNAFSHTISFLRGFIMYLVAVIQTIILRYDILDVKFIVDDEEFEQQAMMIALCNGPREGGGFITGPNAIMDDGVLDYAILGKVSRLMMFRMIPEFMKGTQERFTKVVKPGRFKTMTIDSKQPLYLHTDGEGFAGFSHDVHHLSIAILPNALEVIVPND